MLTESSKKSTIEAQTIKDFGEQWVAFPQNEGYYASPAVLADIFGPLENVENLKDKTVADVGAGSGRIARILCELGAKMVYAVEPSAAMEKCKEYTRLFVQQITYLPERGDDWTASNLDYVLCIGVLHHIHDPLPVLKNFHRNLKSGGKCITWLYGYEGNEAYLRIFEPLRKLTTKIPHFALTALSWFLLPWLKLYAFFCRFLPLPMHAYMREHIARIDTVAQKITIYDQLNPTWAMYYRKQEILDLFAKGGFDKVELYHRHGYSWTVLATKT